MDLIQRLFETLYNVPELIRLGGFIGLILIVFAETGLLVGFFLPGDSLLVTAGIFAARGDFSVWQLIVVLTITAILGDATGYAIGRRAGRTLYTRPDSLLFRREHLRLTQEFYQRHGGKTIVFARFIPIVRTFAPVVAGAVNMPYRDFAVYNIAGGALWVVSTVLGGYLLGLAVPNLEQRIHLLVAGVIVVSLIPPVWSWWRNRSAAQRPHQQSN